MPVNWTIEDEAMKVFTGEGKNPGSGSNGDIVYGDKKFSNFELSIDWKASKMANSGIFFNVREVPGQPVLPKEPDHRRRVDVVLVLGGLHRLGLDQDGSGEADPVLVLDDQVQEARTHFGEATEIARNAGYF